MLTFRDFVEQLNEQNDKEFYIHWQTGPRQGEFKIKALTPAEARKKAMDKFKGGEPTKIVSVGTSPSLYKQKQPSNSKAEIERDIDQLKKEMDRKENADNFYHSSGRYEKDAREMSALRGKLRQLEKK